MSCPKIRVSPVLCLLLHKCAHIAMTDDWLPNTLGKSSICLTQQPHGCAWRPGPITVAAHTLIIHFRLQDMSRQTPVDAPHFIQRFADTKDDLKLPFLFQILLFSGCCKLPIDCRRWAPCLLLWMVHTLSSPGQPH